MAAEPQSPFAATLLSLINAGARSALDRALFGLAPLPKQQPQNLLPTINGGRNDTQAD